MVLNLELGDENAAIHCSLSTAPNAAMYCSMAALRDVASQCKGIILSWPLRHLCSSCNMNLAQNDIKLLHGNGDLVPKHEGKASIGHDNVLVLRASPA